MTKQQQQQPQDVPQQTCTRCGGKSFIDTPIMDPISSRMQHMFRCRSCDHQQWEPNQTD
jgi:hypothetical protein